MLGERLTRLRKDRKLTQQQIADKLHLSRGTYAQYEINRRIPEYATLEKMADFFNVSIDHLVGRELKDDSGEKELDDLRREAFDLISKITDPEKRKEAISYLEYLANKK